MAWTAFADRIRCGAPKHRGAPLFHQQGYDMLEIWGRTNSINVQKVMWTVGELGLEHVRHDAGGQFGGLEAPEFAALNPHRRVPVLKDGDTVVWESNAIVRYLAAKYGAGSLWPEDPGARAAADQWMEWSVTTLQRPFLIAFNQIARTPSHRQNIQAMTRAVKALETLFGLLNAHLAGRDFIAGDAPTIGDIAVGVACYRYFNIEIPRPDIANVEVWHKRLREREAYRQHVEIAW